MPAHSVPTGSRLLHHFGVPATPILIPELSDRVIEALKAHGLRSVGDIMDLYAQGERQMVAAIEDFGVAAMDEVREALRRLGLLGAAWPKERLMRTTVGRIIFNRALPEELWFVNELLDRKGVDGVVARCYKHLGREKTAVTGRQHQGPGLPLRHPLGHHHRHHRHQRAGEEGRHPGAHDRARSTRVEQQYRRGLITDEERYNKVVELWTRATDEVTDAVKDLLSPDRRVWAPWPTPAPPRAVSTRSASWPACAV